MLSLSSLSKNVLERLDKTSDILMLVISNDTKITNFNANFKPYTKEIIYLTDLITYTHKNEFLNKLNSCIETQGIVSFSSNFSFNSKDVEDIPDSYKIILEYQNEKEILVLASAVLHLSHEDARSYFSMINDYSNISRKLQKTNLELKRRNEQLNSSLKEVEFYANYDSLTKIYNRRRIFEDIKNEHEKFFRFGETYSVIMLDIDNFKMINDNHGHQTGDKVLFNFAKLLKETLRKYDSLGRYGGEEFIILLPNTYVKEAKEIANRMLNKVSTQIIEQINITFSAGVSQIEKNQSIDELICLADKNLYEAKRNGKNQII